MKTNLPGGRGHRGRERPGRRRRRAGDGEHDQAGRQAHHRRRASATWSPRCASRSSYPDVKFVHPGGYKRAPNLTTYWASTPEAFYLMGMAAGKTTKTNKLGYVVALPISFFLANVNAFELGRPLRQPEGGDARGVHRHVPRSRPRRPRRPTRCSSRACDVLGVIVDSPISRRADGGEARRLLRRLPLRRRAEVRAEGLGQRASRSRGATSTRASRKQVMDGTWKSEDILGGLGDDYLTIAPFGPAVPHDAVKLVNAEEAGVHRAASAPVFQGPLRDNKGVERVKAGEVFPLSDLAEDGLARRRRRPVSRAEKGNTCATTSPTSRANRQSPGRRQRSPGTCPECDCAAHPYGRRCRPIP